MDKGAFSQIVTHCLAIILTGCVPIPIAPSGEIYSLENTIDTLVNESATKNEVITKLGFPLKYDDTRMSYKACINPGGFDILIAFPYGGGHIEKIREDVECYELVLEFNDHIHLNGYKKEPYSYLNFQLTREELEEFILNFQLTRQEKEEIFLLFAEQGTHEAHYQMYYRSSKRNEKLSWLCGAADSGNHLAQAEVGRLYRWGLHGIKQDHRKAYQWYWLANKRAPDSWRYELNETKRMIAIEEAETPKAMVPGQCKREFLSGDAID